MKQFLHFAEGQNAQFFVS